MRALRQDAARIGLIGEAYRVAVRVSGGPLAGLPGSSQAPLLKSPVPLKNAAVGSIVGDGTMSIIGGWATGTLVAAGTIRTWTAGAAGALKYPG